MEVGLQGSVFKSNWKQNSAYDCTAFHCKEPCISTLTLSHHDLNNVERDIKHKSSSS